MLVPRDYSGSARTVAVVLIRCGYAGRAPFFSSCGGLGTRPRPQVVVWLGGERFSFRRAGDPCSTTLFVPDRAPFGAPTTMKLTDECAAPRTD